MQALNGDPLDWTVDEVVKFLCRDPQTPWSQSASRLPRPDPALFEASLRDNLINGEILLTSVDKQALQVDLGLRALGHRSSIIIAIRYLQQRSQKFQQTHTSNPAPFASLLSPSLMSTPILEDNTPRPSPVHNASSALSNSFGASVSIAAPSTPLLNRPLPMAPISETLNLGNTADNTDNTALAASLKNLQAPTQDNISENPPARHQEQFVIDNHGKKRRRLDLNSSVKAQSDNLAKAIDPGVSIEDWYMGPGALTPDEIFFPRDLNESEDDQTFTLISSNLPTAQRSFVNKRLSYFFRKSPTQLNSKGSSQWAVIPYKPSEIEARSDRCFTLFTSKQGEVHVSKEKIDHWPQLTPQQKASHGHQTSDISLNPADPLGYLLQKYPVQEDSGDSYPLYGDSGSEGEFDNETWQEIHDEQSGPSLPLLQKKTKLGPMEIDAIIKDCVSAYENKWRATHQPIEQYKAWRLWRAARRGNRANQDIKDYTKDISHLTARLQKLQDEVRKTEYASRSELCTQCQCMEHTIFAIQRQKFRVSILEQDACPPKIAAPPKRPKKPVLMNYQDEESLDSDSNIDIMSTGSLDDFIIDDIDIPQARSASPSSSDGDDDVISVSGIRRRTRGRPPRIFAYSSSPSPPGSIQTFNRKPDVIDLTMESPEPDDDLMIETPPLNPVEAIKSNNVSVVISPRINASMSPLPSLGPPDVQMKVEKGSLPDINDMDQIVSVDWELLEERQDRRRLLAKLIGCLADVERRDLARQIPEYQFSKLKHLVQRAMRCLSNGSAEISGLEASESSLIMRTTSFYVSWLNCVHLTHGIPKKYVSHAQKDLQESKGKSFGNFYDELTKRLRFCKTWQRKDNPKPSSTPHKKRKREVKESQAAKQNQASAQLRVAQQETQRKKLEKRWESHGKSIDTSQHAITFEEPIIYLDSYIGQRVKPHQLDGIRFLWRELIEDKSQQGCLLAHTMGLGKTMQVISLLTTISAAVVSDDPKIRAQIPTAFHESRTLILCPSALIENWLDEFGKWTPPFSPIGQIRRVLSSDPPNARLQEVSNWYIDGGVLLISYDIFRRWILNEKNKKGDHPLTETNHQNVKKWLLEGPNIIIADEAHKMKNPKSKTTVAAMLLGSMSRVALTGSPLANNLIDYYTMVNWIAKDYLGTLQEFKANYVEPIEEGLYLESTHREQRKSLQKLEVLKQILEPKINRADISVLEGSLPPKVEFVLTVPLTEVQKVAYNAYAAFVLEGRTEEVGQADLWSWLAILGLCCNHPSCFMEKLSGRANDTAKKIDDAEQLSIPGDEPITEIGIPNLTMLVSEQERNFAHLDITSVELSARAEILKRIVDESVRAGDKVLIFSHSIPTLDYIEHVLKLSQWKYSRLDGQTPIADRQKATKQFNFGAEKQVYLISTRAGGLGLNIPGANRVIIFDFHFSPVWEEQAVGRAYRIGQKKPVFVYRFVSGGTYQDIVHQKALFKTHLSVRVVDKKSTTRHAQKKPGDYLFPVKPISQKDITQYIGKDPLVLDKILVEDQTKENKSILDIRLTETFEREDNDKLTEEEKRTVQEEIDDEHLKRTDPEAYSKRISERYMRQVQQQQAAQSNALFPISSGQVNPPFSIPYSAHNVRPPALAPDMIVYRPVNPDMNPNAIPIRDANPLIQRPHNSPQTPSNEIMDPSTLLNSCLGLTPAQWQQQPAVIKNPPAPARTPNIGTFRIKSSVSNQDSQGKASSEPFKPKSTSVDAPRQETTESHTTSPRGQSAPVHPETPVVEAPRHSSEPSSSDSIPSSPTVDKDPKSGCRNQ
ncbi:hypothetical protein BJX99DRAFT_175940 [Aspergillus californicus]